jgi:hypothetical protein
MIDLHLINLALAGLGVAAAAVVLIAAAILTVAAFGRRGTAARHHQLAPVAAHAAESAAPSDAGDHESLREPALR